ncbi:unnamed protein product [Microthlaspi erraticum]|uniref:DUF4216 domain-containing protein n=1 Tax=Microthlaspi erraticum TaxID=1685480 RepID=A0A6D2KDG0_9BRAS|nr:unnamed protein product [Microthlaspi erraticum]
MFCPCIDCRNVCHQCSETVLEHLVIRGMDHKYKRSRCWSKHGEIRDGKTNDVQTSEHEAYDLIRTAFTANEFKHTTQKQNVDQLDDPQYDEEIEFRKKLENAETPLYSTCENYTKVSAIMGLYRIKVKSGMSENYFDQLLMLVSDMLPGDNVLPKSTDQMKKFLKVFGFGYDNIHACKNDCILYRHEYEELVSCPRCSESRWERDKHSGEEKKGIPAKVLRYFPIKDRLRGCSDQNDWQRSYSGILLMLVPMIPTNSKEHSTRLRWLAFGPRRIAQSYKGYVINGHRFHTDDVKRKTQNSGISYEAFSMCRASAKDTRHMADIVAFYGVIKEIILIDYHMFQVPLFKCVWANKGNGLKEEDGFTLVNLHMSQSTFISDPYILASQAKQVFYSREEGSSPWYVFMRAPPRGYHELETEEEFVSATLRIPTEEEGDNSSDDEAFCVRDDCEDKELDIDEDDTEIAEGNEDHIGISEEIQESGDIQHSEEERVDTDDVEQEVVPPENVAREQEVQTQQSANNKRKTRGPTKMRKVAKNHDDRVEVEFTSLGDHVGSGSVTLSSFLGPLVREHVPVLLDDWRHLDEQTRDTMWEEIQGRFNLKESWQKETVFRHMGCLWRTSKSKLVTLDRATKCKSQLQNLKPSNIQSTAAWNAWVKRKTSEAFTV